MRTIIVIIAMLFLCLQQADTNAQGFEYGAIVGLNVAHISGYDYYGITPQDYSIGGYGKAGLQFGGITSYSFGKWVKLSLDLKYTQKGDYKKSYIQLNDSISWKVRLNYVETNLLLKIKIIKMISAYGGCGYGVLVKKQTEALSGKLPNAFYDVPYTKGDFSFSWGLSAKIVQGLNLNLGLQISMASIVKGQNNIIYSNQYGNMGIYNELVNLTIDYQFGGRKIYDDKPNRNARYL